MGNRLVLVDEAYVEFSNQSVVDLFNRYSNLVVLRTFSKSFGLAGLRLGTVLSCPENIANLSKAHSPYSISGLTVHLAMAAMQDKPYVEAYAQTVKQNREKMERILREKKLTVFPSAGNFVLARFGNRSKEIESALKARNFLVRDRSTDELLEGCLRITIGTTEQTDALLNALNELGV